MQDYIFELAFKSTAASNLDEESLQLIGKLSEKKNAKMDMTGCLVFHENEFVGILEGEKETVKKLFQKIEVDPRHLNVCTLAKGLIRERAFEKWNLIYFSNSTNGSYDHEYDLFRVNLLSLAKLAEKRTYGSRMFWESVEKTLRKKGQN